MRSSGGLQNTLAVEKLSESVADVCRRALEFDDVIALAHSNAPGFRLVTHDVANSIQMYTAPVEASPIHMMKASVTMPCAPAAFLRYLDFDVRSLWDEHFIEGAVLEKFSSDDIALLQRRETKTALQQQQTSATAVSKEGSSSGAVQTAWTAPVTLQLKHVGFLSPVPLLTDRDFELVVAESYDERRNIAVLKALSLPIGAIYPVKSSKYVRGLITLSGFIVSPVKYVDPVMDKEISGCSVTYIALVHPMGLIPAALVNIVVGKQTAGLLQLQTFMRRNPIATLPPKTLEVSKGRVMRRNAVHKSRL